MNPSSMSTGIPKQPEMLDSQISQVNENKSVNTVGIIDKQHTQLKSDHKEAILSHWNKLLNSKLSNADTKSNHPDHEHILKILTILMQYYLQKTMNITTRVSTNDYLRAIEDSYSKLTDHSKNILYNKKDITITAQDIVDILTPQEGINSLFRSSSDRITTFKTFIAKTLTTKYRNSIIHNAINEIYKKQNFTNHDDLKKLNPLFKQMGLITGGCHKKIINSIFFGKSFESKCNTFINIIAGANYDTIQAINNIKNNLVTKEYCLSNSDSQDYKHLYALFTQGSNKQLIIKMGDNLGDKYYLLTLAYDGKIFICQNDITFNYKINHFFPDNKGKSLGQKEICEYFPAHLPLKKRYGFVVIMTKQGTNDMINEATVDAIKQKSDSNESGRVISAQKELSTEMLEFGQTNEINNIKAIYGAAPNASIAVFENIHAQHNTRYIPFYQFIKKIRNNKHLSAENKSIITTILLSKINTMLSDLFKIEVANLDAHGNNMKISFTEDINWEALTDDNFKEYIDIANNKNIIHEIEVFDFGHVVLNRVDKDHTLNYMANDNGILKSIQQYFSKNDIKNRRMIFAAIFSLMINDKVMAYNKFESILQPRLRKIQSILKDINNKNKYNNNKQDEFKIHIRDKLLKLFGKSDENIIYVLEKIMATNADEKSKKENIKQIHSLLIKSIIDDMTVLMAKMGKDKSRESDHYINTLTKLQRAAKQN